MYVLEALYVIRDRLISGKPNYSVIETNYKFVYITCI